MFLPYSLYHLIRRKIRCLWDYPIYNLSYNEEKKYWIKWKVQILIYINYTNSHKFIVKLGIPYFLRKTLHSQNDQNKWHYSPNNSHSGLFLEESVNYFRNFGVEWHLLKIGCKEFSLIKHRGCQCTLPF